jgi:hypothetical protein
VDGVEMRVFAHPTASCRLPSAAPWPWLADLKLKWREWRMSLGAAPAGSSPRAQQDLDLNRDVTVRPKQGEGEKLRR